MRTVLDKLRYARFRLSRRPRIVTTNHGSLVAVERGRVVGQAVPGGDLGAGYFLRVWDWSATDALDLLTQRMNDPLT